MVLPSVSPWLVIGFVGQAMFTGRFLIQWIASERARRSVVPAAFWLFSVGGGATLLAYAIYREDPVFIFGQAAGLLIYGRNIYFLFRERVLRFPMFRGKSTASGGEETTG